MVFSNGVYNGDLNNRICVKKYLELPNGKGTMVYADGTSYIGYWKDGVYHDHGVLKFANNKQYQLN